MKRALAPQEDNYMGNTKLIAVTGLARSGKDSFASEIKRQVTDLAPDKSVGIFAFAEGVRKEIQFFLQENFSISAWTEEEEEKKIIRPFLVAYGNAKRDLSKNRYWIEKLEKQIQQRQCDVSIISDLRFAENETDELAWFKKQNGLHIHLDRLVDGQEMKAPNEFEEKNNPKLREAADVVLKMEYEESLDTFKKTVKTNVENILEKEIGRIL